LRLLWMELLWYIPSRFVHFWCIEKLMIFAHTLTLIYFIHPPPFPPNPPPQSCLSLLILKLVFKRVSQCISAVRILYFGLFNSFHYPFPSHSRPIFQQFSIYILIFSTFTDVVLGYGWYSIVLFSFPSFSELQSGSYITNMFYIWVCIKSCLFFVYIFIFWIYLPCMRENVWPLSFWAWLTSLNMMSSNCIHSP
jgi:hypothetical protein